MKRLLLLSLLTLTWVEESEAVLPPSPVTQQREALIAEANSMGYVVEHVGRVMEKSEKCGIIRFDFTEWFTDDIFRPLAASIFDKWMVAPEDVQVHIDELTSLHLGEMRECFEIAATEWRDDLYSTTDASYIAQFPYSRRTVNLNLTTRHMPARTLDEDARKRELIMLARGDVNRTSRQLVLDFADTLWRLSRKGEVYGTVDTVGGSLHAEIAKSVMGAAYDGSVIRRYGPKYPLSTMSSVSKYGDHAFVAKVCYDIAQVDGGYDAFRIRPIGILRGNTYEYPRVQGLYAKDPEKPGVANLLLARNEDSYSSTVFNRDEIIIVDSLDSTVNDSCSLVTPTKCPMAKDRLDDNGGTLVFQLKNSAFVVTNKQFVEFAPKCYSYYAPRMRIPLRYHTFVADNCMLHIGVRGDRFYPFTYLMSAPEPRWSYHEVDKVPNPDDIVVYLDSFTDPITWYNRKYYRALAVTIAPYIVIALVLIVFVLVVSRMCKTMHVQSKVKDILHK